ncbi:MAG TPA: DUF3343 domain-containing protein [Prolixibacteraceae bacterium]
MPEGKEIFLFQNIRQVILADNWCMQNKVPVRVIPVPRPYSTECGMCLEVSADAGDRLQKFASDQGMMTKRIKE